MSFRTALLVFKSTSIESNEDLLATVRPGVPVVRREAGSKGEFFYF
jgi:hypothetical protein